MIAKIIPVAASATPINGISLVTPLVKKPVGLDPIFKRLEKVCLPKIFFRPLCLSISGKFLGA